MNKVLSFLNNIVNTNLSPVNLINELVPFEQTEEVIVNSKSLRNGKIVSNVITEKFGQLTFKYFFTKLKSSIQSNDFHLNTFFFKKLILNNMYFNFPIFIKLFSKFNVTYRFCNFNAKKFKKN